MQNHIYGKNLCKNPDIFLLKIIFIFLVSNKERMKKVKLYIEKFKKPKGKGYYFTVTHEKGEIPDVNYFIRKLNYEKIDSKESLLSFLHNKNLSCDIFAEILVFENNRLAQLACCFLEHPYENPQIVNK